MAAGFADERKAIESRFATQWAASDYWATPVAYEGVEFRVPDPPSEHVRFFVRSGNCDQITLGGPGGTVTDRYSGVIIASIFMPLGQGTARARAIAEAVSGIFTRAQFSVGSSGLITCRPSYLTLVPTQGLYQQFDVTTPFRRDVQTVVAA